MSNNTTNKLDTTFELINNKLKNDLSPDIDHKLVSNKLAEANDTLDFMNNLLDQLDKELKDLK